ncbi:GerAB/ArcD/ProY family transporter [Pseudalkalibacillus berkeleyi]|uniref:Endospore germination permease n=1 Tax=Pseudalkalibacillus berkeleyi TaxID=1069813 RepID=A0ABS9GY67_9BACL|nr:endospore germination permease [Pseudalkalibacillus berkeleyi]MCF6137674.1 endospore germination permease [Pseudalkalibacillus berkeleyi]
MLKDERISPSQFTLLTTLFTIGSSIIIIPASLVLVAKQDGWISAIVATLFGLLLIYFYSSFPNKYPGKGLPEIIELVFGSYLGKLIIALYFFFSFTLAALVLRNFGDFLKTKIILETPLEAIHIMFLIPVIYAVKLGIETYSRVAELTFPFVILMFIILITLTSPQAEFTNIQPIFGEEAKTIVGGSLSMVGVPFLELILLTTLYSSINNPKKTRKSFLVGVLMGASFLVVTTIYTILVLGVELTSLKVYPTYVWAKKISIADFLERVEVTIAALWGITLFFKLVIAYHVSLILVSKLFKMKDYRILAIPMAFILYVYSLIAYPNSAYFMDFATKTWFAYALLFGLVFPVLLWGVGLFKKDQKT